MNNHLDGSINGQLQMLSTGITLTISWLKKEGQAAFNGWKHEWHQLWQWSPIPMCKNQGQIEGKLNKMRKVGLVRYSKYPWDIHCRHFKPFQNTTSEWYTKTVEKMWKDAWQSMLHAKINNILCKCRATNNCLLTNETLLLINRWWVLKS